MLTERRLEGVDCASSSTAERFKQLFNRVADDMCRVLRRVGQLEHLRGGREGGVVGAIKTRCRSPAAARPARWGEDPQKPQFDRQKQWAWVGDGRGAVAGLAGSEGGGGWKKGRKKKIA